MTPDYIARLREAGEKATAGEWRQLCGYVTDGSMGNRWRSVGPSVPSLDAAVADYQLIALARNAWPALVEVVALAEKLQECIDWCEKEDEPVSGYVCERNDPLRAALARLRASVGEGGQNGI